ncbi:GPI ethanolamine phosphate transferase 1 [Epargyreus clarus]|uniref:GPI ethanolamine phosphate transferase 1 n=1 Tax=Epargyreus clarus TaxID=520877 RepID=UPI003C2C2269
MFLIGIFIHLTFLFSIFDVYFKSPIVKNVVPYQPLHEAPADRLVLFVVDGLRAESFVNYTTMPYLRSVANSNGRWGISSTRVPTESRPGHVAIIAGFYEDPSAVTKGWKENPVDFDSVLNQTTYAWCWGTYDILEIFTKENVDHIFVDKLGPYDQSFSADKNTTHLDAWVFDKVKLFFEEAKNNKTINKRLHSKKIMFFLHLLGTDTSGHTHKPKTTNFLTTIKFVDENIKEIEHIIKDFYNDDGKTTFLVTSDHGMTDWGSHGTGDDHETETPYVLWGAGVKQVQNLLKIEDPESLQMSLEHKYNIKQADLAPIMSTFLSIPVPVNSVGQLTTEIFNMSQPNEAKAIYSNSRQLLSQYNKKRLDVEANVISLLYQPYDKFTTRKIEDITTFTEMLMQTGDYEQLIELSKEIMELSLSGLNYYHNYFQMPLLVTITLSFVGWILYLLKILLSQATTVQADISTKSSSKSMGIYRMFDSVLKVLCILICCVIASLIYVQNLPAQYYIYFLMPILLWFRALRPIDDWVRIARHLKRKRSIFLIIVQIVCYYMGSVAMAFSFSYRWMLSIPLMGIALWPLLSSSRKYLNKSILIVWPISCLLLSAFSFMPVVGKNVFIELVLLAGLIWAGILSTYIQYTLLPHYYKNKERKRETIISLIHVVLLLISLYIIYIQARRFESEEPVSQTLQSVCWIISAILLLLPLMYTKRLISRIMGINSSIITFYLLLSVSHEGLFMVTLLLNITCWIFIEHKQLNQRNVKILDASFDESANSGKSNLVHFERNISSHDFRRAFIFTLYIILAYFGTGNIASLNSFEVRWVTCFTTSFQPYIITGLILAKTLCPFLSVGCSFAAIQHLTKAPTGYLNIIVLIYSNIMGIQLLYYVKNTGSWLEIGTSISQYVIVQMITVFIVFIHQASKVLTDVDAFRLAMYVVKNGKKQV